MLGEDWKYCRFINVDNKWNYFYKEDEVDTWAGIGVNFGFSIYLVSFGFLKRGKNLFLLVCLYHAFFPTENKKQTKVKT